MTRYFEPISFDLLSSDPDTFASSLGKSFRETGFAVLTDHPVSTGIIDRATEAMKAFFALPTSTKLKYDDRENGGQRGYTAFATENAKGEAAADQKEFWHTGRADTPGSQHADTMRPTPSVPEVADFDIATCALFDALDDLGQSLLTAVAIDLGLEPGWFTPRVREGNSILRLLHYPPQLTPPPPGSVRAAAHEDINVITLLLGAEEAGLQVQHRSGEWLSVNPPPGALVINVGDMLQRLTGGLLPSTTHRVMNPAPDRAHLPRYSTPFFLHFAPDVLIEPLQSCLNQGAKAFAPISAHDYLMERLREIGLVKD
ncbi:MAG: 2OG-Fe(II) oxygenase family protein [Pseudomonadota bacterium]